MEKSVTVPKVRIYKLPEGKEVLREVEMVPSAAPTPDTPYVRFSAVSRNLFLLTCGTLARTKVPWTKPSRRDYEG